MQAVSVQTTQNIELEYPMAGIGERMLALLLDLLIIISFYVIVFGMLAIVGVSMPFWLEIIISIVGYLYRFFAEVFYNGQTVGKSVMKIKVVKLDGSAPSVAAYFLRWLLEPLDFFIVGLGALLVILTKRGQRLGDLLAATTVIKIKKITATNMRNRMLMRQIDEDYEPTIPEAANLTDVEIHIIKDAIKAYREDGAKHPAAILEQKLKDKYGMESAEPTLKFLYLLLKDHTYYVSQ